jgi:transcriptional regulator with XRE-family HTH domain
VSESPTMDPAERVRQRLSDWMEVAGLTQREFAGELHRSQPWLDKILTGENAVRLKDLDDIATKMRTTAADLVREPSERRVVELTPTELRLIERLRRKPELLSACVTLVEAHRGDPKPTPVRPQRPTAVVSDTQRRRAR